MTYNDLIINESDYILKNGKKGRLAVFIYTGTKEPSLVLDMAIKEYVKEKEYQEFVDYGMGNPWVRVILSNVDDMFQTPFNPEIHSIDKPILYEELRKICEDLEMDMNNLTQADWLNISEYRFLSDFFIVNYKDNLDVDLISENQTLSEFFIENHQDWLDAKCILVHQTLSESFIEVHKDWLDAEYVSMYQTLSETFIERHKDWLDTNLIQACQFMSDTFINRIEFAVDEYNNKLFDI